MCVALRGGSRGAIGAIVPVKPTKVTLFSMILHNSENSIRNIIRKTLSIIRLYYQLLLKSPPLNLRSGSGPG